MRKRDSVVLIGFMGSGKSTIGLGLCRRLRLPFIDTDRMIELREGRSIPEIFAGQGEEYFREKETKLLRELQGSRLGEIYSVGGGTPLRAENRELLRKLGTVIYLKVSAETVIARLKNDATRPLLQGDNPERKIRALLREREEYYREIADMTVVTDGKKPAQVTEEITAQLRENKRRNKGGERI